MVGQRSIFQFMNMALGNYRNCLGTSQAFIIVTQQKVGLKTETKEKLKSLKIPDAPKKPLTPYFRFLNEQRTVISKANPNLTIAQVTKKCAEEWNITNPTIKEKYQTNFKRDLEDYSKKFLEYNAALSDEQKEALKSAKAEERASKQKRKLKKRLKDCNRPKRPLTSYTYFIKDKMGNFEGKDRKLENIIALCKGEWSNLSESQKEKYERLSRDDKKRYENEMAVWEEKMIATGNSDIVRGSTVAPKKPSRLNPPKKVGSP